MVKRRGTFAWSPLRGLMKKAGAEIVSRDAVEQLLLFLEDRAKSLTSSAIKLSKHSKRKKVTKSDVELAITLEK
jgi:histone H3/H4